MKIQLLLSLIEVNGNIIQVVGGYSHSRSKLDNVIKENVRIIKKIDQKTLDEALKAGSMLCSKKEAKFTSGDLYLKPIQESSN